MSRIKTAVLDIHGVLADFEGKFCEDFGLENRHLYSLTQRYPNVPEELIYEWVHSESTYRDLNPMFGGLTLAKQLKDRGYQIYLLTACPNTDRMYDITKKWLHTYSVAYDNLTFSSEKGSQIRKWSLAGKNVEVFVDDSESNISDVRYQNPGVTCLAWASPWNLGVYPRLRYNEVEMEIEANIGNGRWRHMWIRGK
jgi:5'(3')-deoxyribonucleotidase